MDNVTIRRCTVSELESAPNLGELLEEYALESSSDEIGEASAQFASYRAMESSGLLHPFAAFENGKLVGFLLMVASVLPHYGALMAATESFFVAKQARCTGAGLALLRASEVAASGIGAKGLLVSAPVGSRLDSIMQKVGKHMSNIYIMALK